MIIPILMHFYSFLSIWTFTSPIKPLVIQGYVTYLMMSSYFQQYILSQIFEVIQSEVALQKQVH